jgi:ribosome recycling factor
MNDPTMKKELNDNLKSAKEHFAGEIAKLRTGRAHQSMVQDLRVEVYGAPTPLIQVATVTTPEPQLIQISPFDPSTMKDISESIRKNESLGFNPVDDGRIIRIQIPALTTERRQQIVKQLGEKQKEAMIGIRKARQEAMNTVSKAKKDKEIGEDEANRFEKDIESLIADAKTSIEEQAKEKETEILKV